MKTAKLIAILLCLLVLEGCVAESVADQREADARRAGYSNGYQTGYAQGHSEGYEKGRGEVQAPALEAQQLGHSLGYREGWHAGDAKGYDRGRAEGQVQGFRDAYPGRTPNAGPAVDPYFRLVSVLGGLFLIVASAAFCGIMIARSSHLWALLGKCLAVILGAAATFILYMTMGFGDAVSDVLLAPSPSNRIVFPFILVVAIVVYGLFAGARWLLRSVSAEEMEAICIVAVSATTMAIIILLTRILSVTPSFADYMISSMMAGVLLGTIAYVMMWFIRRGRAKHSSSLQAAQASKARSSSAQAHPSGESWKYDFPAGGPARSTPPPAPPPSPGTSS